MFIRVVEMEDLLKFIVEHQEVRNDNFLLDYNKSRVKRVKRRHLLLENQLLSNKRHYFTKVDNYTYFDTIKTYEDDVFQKHFQMTRATFTALRKSLQPFWTTALCGRLGYSLEKCLYITLWKLCNNNSTFQELSDRFQVAKGTTHRIFYKTIELIGALKYEISWPTAAQQRHIMEHFQNSKHNPLPFVIGCVNEMHFSIPTPKHDTASYYNHKGNHTIIMQAICDSKLRFLDVFIGCPGSYHNAQVWNLSPIFKAISAGEVELAENAFMLADFTYPLSKFVLTPYNDNGHLSPAEKQFNFYSSVTRAAVNQVFGLLKQRFQILKHINLESIQKASNVIYACAILHNFIMNRENVTEYITDDLTTAHELDDESLCPYVKWECLEEDESDADGVAIRRNLTTLFCS